MMAKQKQASNTSDWRYKFSGGEESNWYKTSKAGRVFCTLTRPDGECVGSDYWDHPAKEDPSHHDT